MVPAPMTNTRAIGADSVFAAVSLVSRVNRSARLSTCARPIVRARAEKHRRGRQSSVLRSAVLNHFPIRERGCSDSSR
jgi:hypothetical protein